MALPTSDNTVNVTRLGSILSRLWTKIKTAFDSKEDTANKTTAWGNTPSDIKYPSEKLVKDSLDAKAPNAVTTEAAIATGDKLLFSDSSDSNKIKRNSTAFDTNTKSKYLGADGTFNQVKEGDVAWGGEFHYDLSPIEMACFPQNLLANPPADRIKFERTTDGGTTWTEISLTENAKKQFFNLTLGTQLPANGGSASSDPDVLKLLRGRVTIAFIPFGSTSYSNTWCYGNGRRLLLLASRASSEATHCLIEYQTGRHFIANDGSWTTIGDYPITGDTGWNSIPFSLIIGGYSAQLPDRPVALRITYWVTAPTSSGGAGRVSLVALGIIPSIVWTSAADLVAKQKLPVVLNNDGSGTVERANRLATARQLAVSLSNTSTNTSFNGSADVTNIKTTGTLGVGNGGTGRTTVTADNFLVGNGSSALVEKTPTEVRTLIGAGTSNLTIGSSSTEAASGDHKHGTMHSSFTRDVPNQTDTSAPIDNTWLSNIGLENNGFWLKSLLTRSRVADWLISNSGAGIAFGGGDTKGIITMDWNPNQPRVRFAAGNGTSAQWYWTMWGTSGKTYTLPSDTCALQAALPTSGTASTTYAINVSGNAATATSATSATTATNYDTNGGTIKTTFESKLDIAPVGLAGPADLLTLVKSLGANNIRYRRWCCATSGSSDNIDNRPNSDQSAFMLEAFAKRWASASDYQYELIYFRTNTSYPYIASITQNTTSITWSDTSNAPSADTATTANTASNFNTSSGTIKSSLDSKVDIESAEVLATSDYHWDIISQVASIASQGLHYKRWICKSDGSSAYVDYRPNSDNASFMLEAYAVKWNSYEDCKYKLVYWRATKKTPYVAELIFFQSGGLYPQTITWYDTGVADSASKLTTARKTYVTLGTASTSTTRDWSGDTTIPVDGTLGVGNGGTGKSSVTANNFLVGNGSSALVEKTPTEVRTLIGAGTSSLTIGSSSTQAAAGDHKHGTLHSSFAHTVPNQSSDTTWETNLSLANNGFWLKSLRMQANAPDWLMGNYGSGIAFGGSDTKGVISLAYDPNSARVRFAGGGGSSTSPQWYWTLRGTSGKTYTLPSDTCALQAELPTSGTASTTYAVNVSGNASTADTATNYNTSSGNIKTALEAKVESITQNGTSITPANGVADIGYMPITEGQATATVQEVIQALRVKPGGRMGSVLLNASTIGTTTISSAWYNYLWIPHRNGAATGDSQNYGTLIITPLTDAPDVYVIEGTQLNTTPTYRIKRLTDTMVKATAKTDNVQYKILATASASPTSGATTEAVYDADITLNPSTNTIAANITGDAQSVRGLYITKTIVNDSNAIIFF